MDSKTILALAVVLASWVASVVLVLPVASGPALALSSAFAPPSAKTQPPVGFRLPATESIESATQLVGTAKARLDQCIATWDHGTHITPSSWRRICEGNGPEVPSATESIESAKQLVETAKARLDQCIATWDQATDMTPSDWRQICERQLKAIE